MVTRDTAAVVRDAVVDAIDPLEIILFGSIAREASGRDIDLLVVTDEDGGSTGRDRRAALRSALRPLRHRYDIDDYVVTRSALAEYVRQGSPFVRKIISDGVCIYMRKATKAWRRQAEEERDTAAYLRAGGFHRGACDHAQQCVEKSIKTMLLEVGWELEKIHNIHRLTALATDHGAPLSLTPDDIDFLDAIYRGDPTAADAERAVTLADNSFATLNRFLASRAQPEASDPTEGPSPSDEPDGDDSC